MGSENKVNNIKEKVRKMHDETRNMDKPLVKTEEKSSKEIEIVKEKKWKSQK